MTLSMTSMILLLAAGCMAASTAQSARSPQFTHHVKVGGVDAWGKPILKFDPPFIHAWPGDFVEFDFHPANHSATVSSFEEPCAHNITDFDSGFMPTTADASIRPTSGFTVTDTDPIWMYCRQKGKGPKTHCQSGMVFAVNPKHHGHTFNAFLKNAEKSTIQDQPTETTTTTTSPPTSMATSSSTTHVIKVGGVDSAGNPVLKFDPPFISAVKGDFVEFEFNPANHSATVSSFDEPCAHNATDFDSGFMPTTANDTVHPLAGFAVTDENPIWMYCRQKGKGPKTHCQSGMVFAVNPKPTGHTFDAFLANALKSTVQNTNSSPSLGY